MLCPEVWTFHAPDSTFKCESGDFKQSDKTNHFHYNHIVSVVLPETLNVPESLSESLTNDCEYYKLSDISLEKLVAREFVDNFVKKGKFIGLSIERRIDCEDCVCVTPTGKLILSLTKESYQSLGLEGKVSHFCKKTKSRYNVTINLLSENFFSNMKNYQRTKECLSKLTSFTIIINWTPPDPEICPSSVAKYFSDIDCNIKVCKPRISSKTEFNVKVPVIDFKDFELEDGYDLMEWLGMVRLGCDLDNCGPDHFLNSYSGLEETQEVGQVKILEWRGFFTVEKISELLEKLRKYVLSMDKMWASIYVQGFSDSPINWSENEHHFYTNGDNGFALIFNNDRYILCKQGCSNKHYK